MEGCRARGLFRLVRHQGGSIKTMEWLVLEGVDQPEEAYQVQIKSPAAWLQSRISLYAGRRRFAVQLPQSFAYSMYSLFSAFAYGVGFMIAEVVKSSAVGEGKDTTSWRGKAIGKPWSRFFITHAHPAQ
jgi:hypothetical protein